MDASTTLINSDLLFTLFLWTRLIVYIILYHAYSLIMVRDVICLVASTIQADDIARNILSFVKLFMAFWNAIVPMSHLWKYKPHFCIKRDDNFSEVNTG